MNVVAIRLTPAQRDLLTLLIAEAVRDPADLERRWLKAAPFVRALAERGRLLLVRDWTQSIVISPDGDVTVIDTEEGAPDRLATPAERRQALFRAIRHYPELLSFLPERPASAKTCPDCGGTGVHAEALKNPVLRNVVCGCGGSGWLVEESSNGE